MLYVIHVWQGCDRGAPISFRCEPWPEFGEGVVRRRSFSMKVLQRKILPFGEGVFQTQHPEINHARQFSGPRDANTTLPLPVGSSALRMGTLYVETRPWPSPSRGG